MKETNVIKVLTETRGINGYSRKPVLGTESSKEKILDVINERRKEKKSKAKQSKGRYLCDVK